MDGERAKSIRESYDRIADEYARRIYRELGGKPFDRELLTRFANEVKRRGVVCDLGCGPGHVAKFLHGLGTNVFGLDISAGMVEQARQLNPEMFLKWSRCGAGRFHCSVILYFNNDLCASLPFSVLDYATVTPRQ
jgi:SAM-dependent methyltransferase